MLGCAAGVAGAAEPPAKLADGVLVGPNGKTLYTFDKDAPNSGKSTCNGPCASVWPPLAAGRADQPAAPYSIVTRDDGTKQWAYKGKPLYFYQADQKPGDRSGDKVSDVWHVVKE
ncbi:lipoprotein [Caldimonas brevitalea]|uniref:Lipoprotein n=1 Tax=Caldimonas brevitalea TaxID=413882 RepID=A0A0G3BJ14_9BURK|nr:lipoprotein [Caldimonas brevitalea]